MPNTLLRGALSVCESVKADVSCIPPEIWVKILQYFSAFEARMLLCACKQITNLGIGGVVKFSPTWIDFYWIPSDAVQVEKMLNHYESRIKTLQCLDTTDMDWYSKQGNTSPPTKDVVVLWFKEYANSVLRKAVECDLAQIDDVYILPLFDLYELFHGKDWESEITCLKHVKKQNRARTHLFIDIIATHVRQPVFTERIIEMSQRKHWQALRSVFLCPYNQGCGCPHLHQLGEHFGDADRPFEIVLFLLSMIGLNPVLEDYDIPTVNPKHIKGIGFTKNTSPGDLVKQWHMDCPSTIHPRNHELKVAMFDYYDISDEAESYESSYSQTESDEEEEVSEAESD